MGKLTHLADYLLEQLTHFSLGHILRESGPSSCGEQLNQTGTPWDKARQTAHTCPWLWISWAGPHPHPRTRPVQTKQTPRHFSIDMLYSIPYEKSTPECWPCQHHLPKQKIMMNLRNCHVPSLRGYQVSNRDRCIEHVLRIGNSMKLRPISLKNILSIDHMLKGFASWPSPLNKMPAEHSPCKCGTLGTFCVQMRSKNHAKIIVLIEYELRSP